MVKVDAALVASPGHSFGRTFQSDYCAAEGYFGMGHASFRRNEIANLPSLNFLFDESVVAVKIGPVIVFFRYSISDESRCDFERYLSRSFDIDRKLRFARRMFRRKRPSFKGNRCYRLVIEFYDAAFSDKPIVSFTKVDPQRV